VEREKRKGRNGRVRQRDMNGLWIDVGEKERERGDDADDEG